MHVPLMFKYGELMCTYYCIYIYIYFALATITIYMALRQVKWNWKLLNRFVYIFMYVARAESGGLACKYT